MILTTKDDATLIQACINQYGGKHGDINYSMFDRETIETFDNDNIEWYSGNIKLTNGSALAIIIRGSDEPDDWKANFRFFSTRAIPFGNKRTRIRLHRGFLADHMRMRAAMQALIERVQPEKIIVAGHSKGAAQALIASSDIQYNYPHIDVACRAFASPRVGNTEYWRSREYRVPDTKCYRYMKDIVTHIPLIIYEESWHLVTLKGKSHGVFNDHRPKYYLHALNKIS
jgi:predicted lipase